ncbi:MAG: type VI secretion system tip protein VgrG [Burkholderiales bacterium]
MAASPRDQADGVFRLSVKSGGQALAETIEFVSVSVNRTVNAIPYARLVILDGDMPGQTFPLSEKDAFKPGAVINISAGYGDQESTIFEGIVVRHGIKITGANDARLVIECRDKAVAMTVGRKNVNYVDKKDSDILQAVVGSYSSLTSDIGATTLKHKELVQYYCTDWDFALARAEANGFLVIVEDGKFIAKPPQVNAAAELKVAYGADLIELHGDIDARTQYSKVKASAWDQKTQAVIESTSSPQTLNEQGNLASGTLAQVIGLSEFRLQTPVPLVQDALATWAKAQQIKSALARVRGRMKFQGSALAKAGSLIELAGVGARFNGKVFVSAVHHDIADGDWITEVEFGLAPDWMMARGDVMAPDASGLLPGVRGLQVGVVTKLDADPEGESRVQVRVPVMQAEKDTVWARLVNFYGSSGFGAYFIPEIGDEVLLGYLNGDPSHPVILGSLYSSKRAPPYPLSAENNTKAIVTRSKTKIEINDDKKIITIQTPANNKVVISDDGKSILLQDQTNNKVELNSGGITLDSPKDIKITAKGAITLDAVGAISVTSKADVKSSGLNVNCDAQVGFAAKGAASAEISASGTTTVKGAMVMIN